MCVRGIYMCVRGIYMCVRGIYMCVRGIYMCVRGIYMCVRGIYICVLEVLFLPVSMMSNMIFWLLLTMWNSVFFFFIFLPLCIKMQVSNT